MKRKVVYGVMFFLIMGMLGGCAPKEEVTTSVEDPVSVEVSVPVSTSIEEKETASSQKKEVPPQIVEPEWDECSVEVEFPEGINILKFNGNFDKVIKVDEYSAYESEKYVLLVDKGLELPGNYNLVLDEIIDCYEEKTGLCFKTTKKNFKDNMVPTLTNEFPFADLKSADKYIIQLNGREVPSGKINSYDFWASKIFRGYIVMYDRGMDTIPGVMASESDYITTISQLGMGLKGKYLKQFCDDKVEFFYSEMVQRELEEKYTDFKLVSKASDYYHLPTKANKASSEPAWIQRPDSWDYTEYHSFLFYFYKYLSETQGINFVSNIFTEEYSDYIMDREAVAKRYKEVFGESVFRDYITWLKKQSVGKAEALSLNPSQSGFFTADKYYYIEGEDCFVYVEAGINMPYDYVETADMIVKELSAEMWQTDNPLLFDESYKSNTGLYYGISNNGKLPISLNVDEDNLGLISYCSWPDVVIYDYGMKDMDLNEVKYYVLAHECSHAVVDAGFNSLTMGKIMTEGIAEYFGRKAIDALGINTYISEQYYDYKTPINSNTAEELFLNDFQDVSHADRGAEYYYGYWFTRFLAETYGDSFLVDMKKANLFAGISNENNIADREKRVEAFKKTFGDDVFSKFGEWYEQNSD